MTVCKVVVLLAKLIKNYSGNIVKLNWTIWPEFVISYFFNLKEKRMYYAVTFSRGILTSQLAILVLGVCSFSCNFIEGKKGNGNMVSETRIIDRFNTINVSGNYEVHLEQGKGYGIRILADENLMGYIVTSVDRGTLTIRNEASIFSRKGIKVFVEFKNIDRISCSGASSISSKYPLSSKKINIGLSGAGKIMMELDTKILDVDLSGAGLLTLSGHTSEFAIDMSGAGSLEAFGLEAKNCTVDISGLGSANVNVSGTLIASVSGIGGVKYLGKPENVNTDISGIGKVSQAHN